MKRALALARRAGTKTLPNPLVGAVIFKDGQIVGEGWHQQAGGEHAETLALNQAGEAAKGATLCVNLEPCAHHGKTPPCVEQIISAGISKVIFAMKDPNSLAAGGGELLRKAGVEVMEGLEEKVAARLNTVWLHSLRSSIPFVTLKLAVSRDQRLAAAKGVRTVISSKQSRAAVQKLRFFHEAILVGSETARIDKPRLDCRLSGAKQPLKIVLDSELSLDPTLEVFKSPSLVVCAAAAEESRQAVFREQKIELLAVGSSAAGWLDLSELLAKLSIRSLLVEGGAKIAESFLTERLVHCLVVYQSPDTLEGDGPVMRLDEASLKGHGLSLYRQQKLGRDTVSFYNV